MRARERQRLEWRRTARRLVTFAVALGTMTTYRDAYLRSALGVILIHGPVPLRPQAKELLGRLG